MSAYTASYGLRCAALRLTNVYGPGMQAKDSIVARLMRAIRLGGSFEIYGDGRQVRDYVHVSDVIAAMRLGLVNEQWSGPVVIGSGQSLSVLEVVDAVREVTGADVSSPSRAGQARRDAGGDRRPQPRSRGRMVAAVHVSRRASGRLGGVVADRSRGRARGLGAVGVPGVAGRRQK